MFTIALFLYGCICLFVAACYENHEDWKLYQNASLRFLFLGITSIFLSVSVPSVPLLTSMDFSSHIIMNVAMLFGAFGVLVLMIGVTFHWTAKDPSWDLPD